MNRDDIIRMAREAGIECVMVRPEDMVLYRFAALVAAHTLTNIDPSSFMSYQEGFEAGQLAEREACAKVCEEPGWNAANWCAKAIRARGAHQNS